ncbi:ATP-binding protein [Oceanithermus sp.]|uniref:ATP-binding protein n=1 Tax=Oceanithermus sp. TaxID=2268145 RepID=UPI0025D39EEF|nr:ATP-binding protein [Oceanithermus sp.]
MRRVPWLSRLEGRFTLAAAAAGLLPLLVVGAVAWYGLSRSYLGLAGARIESEAARLQGSLDGRLETLVGVLGQALDAPGDEAWALRYAAARLPEVVALQVREGGEVRAIWSRFEVDPRPLEPLARPQTPEAWGPVRRDGWGEPQLRLGLAHPSGRMLEAQLRAPVLWDALVELRDPTLHAYLTDAEGRYLASSNRVEVLRGASAPAAVLAAEPGSVFRYRDGGGVERLAVVRPVDRLGGRLVVEAPVGLLLAPLSRSLFVLLASVLLAMAASFWPGWRLARAVTRPLDELARGARELERGALEAPLEPSGPPEARAAVRAFNRMAAELERNRTELEDYAQHLEDRVAERTEALRLALDRALEADRAKTRFLASVSHELRTPLANIKGFASTLLATDVAWKPEEAAEFLRIIESEADRMHYLVNDLLDRARGERGEFSVTPVLQDATRLLAELEPRLRRLAAGHPFRLRLPEAPLCVPLDADRVRSVLVNLVENAVKYGPAGGAVEVALEERPGEVRFAVYDEGEGVPPELEERVFEAFFRADEGTNGTGLGLAIARAIVEAHGGAIGVGRERGRTVVWFALPRGGCEDV